MRTPRSLVLTASLAVAFLAPASARADLIVNGSFESPAVPVGSYTNFLGGSTAITGWTVVGVDSTVANGTYQQAGITFQAQSGSQWIDLAGVTSNNPTSGVTQTVATTAGRAYDLSFYVGSATDRELFFASTVDLSINGGARSHYTNSTAPSNRLDWQLFTVRFTAAGPTSLAFLNGSASNNFLTGLDNVSLVEVQAVPEPGTLALLATGLPAIAVVGRLRGRAA